MTISASISYDPPWAAPLHPVPRVDHDLYKLFQMTVQSFAIPDIRYGDEGISSLAKIDKIEVPEDPSLPCLTVPAKKDSMSDEAVLAQKKQGGGLSSASESSDKVEADKASLQSPPPPLLSPAPQRQVRVNLGIAQDELFELIPAARFPAPAAVPPVISQPKK